MKRVLISLAIVTMLIATIVMPAMAVEVGKDAVVTVTEVLDISITDTGDDGIQFGTLDPDTDNNPDVAQSTGDDSTPAVTVSVNTGTNVNCDINIKGTDFHTTIPISNAKWALRHDDTPTAMSDTYDSVATDIAPENTVGIWHFLTIPSDAAGGEHHSTFTYEVVGTGP